MSEIDTGNAVTKRTCLVVRDNTVEKDEYSIISEKYSEIVGTLKSIQNRVEGMNLAFRAQFGTLMLEIDNLKKDISALINEPPPPTTEPKIEPEIKHVDDAEPNEEDKLLVKLYRVICQRCHPDRTDDAHLMNLFHDAGVARSTNNIDMMEYVYIQMMRRLDETDENVDPIDNTAQYLEVNRIERLKQAYENALSEYNHFLRSQEFLLLSSFEADKLDTLKKVEQGLRTQLYTLRIQYNQYLLDKNKSSSTFVFYV